MTVLLYKSNIIIYKLNCILRMEICMYKILITEDDKLIAKTLSEHLTTWGYETYCINQGLATPNGNDYNGQIITPDELREFTKQETNIDTEGYTINKYILIFSICLSNTSILSS